MKKLYLALFAALFMVGCGDEPEDVAKEWFSSVLQNDLKASAKYVYFQNSAAYKRYQRYLDSRHFELFNDKNLFKHKIDYVKATKLKNDSDDDDVEVKIEVFTKNGPIMDMGEFNMKKKNSKWLVCDYAYLGC